MTAVVLLLSLLGVVGVVVALVRTVRRDGHGVAAGPKQPRLDLVWPAPGNWAR
jgi:hypothetical protein